MAAKLDMALVDIIQQSAGDDKGKRGRGRGARRGGRGRGRASGGDATRVPANPLSREEEAEVGSAPIRRTRQQSRPAPYQRRNGSDDQAAWSHDKFGASGSGAANSGQYDPVPAVFVSNLDPTITAKEVQDVFGSQRIQVKGVTLNYDQHGHPNGTAEVTFNTSSEAVNASRILDQAEVDGRVMAVKVLNNLVSQKRLNVKTRENVWNEVYIEEPVVRGRRGRGAPRARGATRGRVGGRGRGRGGRGRGAKPAATLEQLNADLDGYHNMQVDSTPAITAASSQPAAPPAAPTAVAV